jgi:glycosyltransferase involved in cell wall biosynthesis
MVFDIARTLVARGHAVTVCTTDALDRGQRVREREEMSHGVRVVRFPNLSNWMAYHLKIFLPAGMERWLAEHVREFDVVHLFDARTLPNAWASREAERLRVPFVLSVWGSLPRGDGWRALIKMRYDRKHLGRQLTRASALLAQNDHEAAVYQEYGGDPARIQLWPLGVDPESVADLPPRGTFRIREGIPSSDPVVLFVGRLHALKGIRTLLGAFAEAQRAIPTARLVVVGRDDGFKAEMDSLVHSLGLSLQFHFAGALYGRDALPAYVDADLFCITPTHFEETSLAALTACACGTPALINDRCGIPWLEERAAGFCLPHDENRIAQKMRELLGDTSALREMGARARRLVEERFFLPRVIDQLESVYREAAR